MLVFRKCIEPCDEIEMLKVHVNSLQSPISEQYVFWLADSWTNFWRYLPLKLSLLLAMNWFESLFWRWRNQRVTKPARRLELLRLVCGYEKENVIALSRVNFYRDLFLPIFLCTRVFPFANTRLTHAGGRRFVGRGCKKALQEVKEIHT